MAIGGHGHAPPFNLRRHRVETTLHLAGSGWSDCTSVWCDVFLFSLSNPDWIIFCSSYVTLLWAWTPWGLTTTLNQTPFVRFSTPVVQPMDGPHSHTQISPQALSQVGWCLRLGPLPELPEQLDDAAAAVVAAAAAAAVRVYVVAFSWF